METTLNTSILSASATPSVTANGENPSELFTTLLVAQIRNQNPLEPTDPSEFVGQLTQLSQMEALQKLVSQSNASASMLESLQVLALGAQVGSEVRVRTDRVTLSEDVVHGSFELSGASGRTTLVVAVAGQEHRIELGSRPPGEVPFQIDPRALGIPEGSYLMWVETDSGQRPDIELFAELLNVRFSPSGGLALSVAHLGDVAASSVTGFNGRPNQSN